MRSNFDVRDIGVFKQKVLNWLKQFNTFCFLDSSQYQGQYEFLAAAGAKAIFQSSDADALEQFQAYITGNGRWMFGHLGYELATAEKICHSAKADQLLFPIFVSLNP
ncbi:hypothetical protein LWM68_02135 [Niabella sp. W65]|nr:hypothetical protein [Niabella sp. W65]MCH7361687.1 hypothetical protein [Niabella sp. W65]ULT45462.1 hypothetical protein KRR40_20650 [Niabella sp. I65]